MGVMRRKIALLLIVLALELDSDVRESTMDGEQHLRKLALQIADQLPDEQKQAHRVLDLVQELVDNWLFRKIEPNDPAEVIPYPSKLVRS